MCLSKPKLFSGAQECIWCTFQEVRNAVFLNVALKQSICIKQHPGFLVVVVVDDDLEEHLFVKLSSCKYSACIVFCNKEWKKTTAPLIFSVYIMDENVTVHNFTEVETFHPSTKIN